MTCPKCKSENIQVQTVNEVKEKRKKGCLYWLFIGWWWEPMAWLFLTLPKLIIAIFGKHTKVVSKQLHTLSVKTAVIAGKFKQTKRRFSNHGKPPFFFILA